MDVALGVVLCGGGLYGIAWALLTATGIRRAREVADAGSLVGRERAELIGTAQTHPLGPSPLQGLPCVHWNVRVVRIVSQGLESRGRLHTIVDADQTSLVPFTVDTATGPVTIDPEHSRTGSGHRVLRRDQASSETTLTVHGVVHRLPPSAHGSRNTSEAVVQPGQPLWVWGDVQQSARGLVISGTPDRPLRIDLVPQAVRRRRGLLVCGLVGGVGVLFLAIGLRVLT